MYNDVPDRSGLTRLAEAYLDALAAHDPDRLPFAPDARFSENGQSLPLGDGLWRTVDAPIGYHLIFADSSAESVGLFAALHENGQPTILAARIAVAAGRIAELETIVVRHMGALCDPEGLAETDAMFRQALAPGAAASRAELVAAADLYFEGIERDDGGMIPFARHCYRFENGVRVTESELLEEDTIYTKALAAQSAADQISSKFFHYIKRIRDRRYPIVDVERGLVAGIVLFDHPADDLSVKLPDGSDLPMPPEALWPSSALLYYLFKLRDGKIAGLAVNYMMLPYGAPSPWPAGESAAAQNALNANVGA